MSSTKPTEAYPLSTKGSEVIPHEIALPCGVLALSVPASGTIGNNTLPANTFMIAITSEVDCFLDFRSTPSAVQTNVFAPGVFYVKANTTAVISILAMDNAAYNTLTVQGLGTAGSLYIQAFSAWGAVGEETQRGTL